MLPSLSALWRYPVKSMHGESISEASLTPHGLDNDRRYAFESTGAPPGMLRLTGAERRNMLRFHARTDPASTLVSVSTPDGRDLRIDDPALVSAFASPNGITLTECDEPQTDCRPLSIISLQTLRLLSLEFGAELDPRRFRPNLILDLPDSSEPFPEDILVGSMLQIGSAHIRILERDPRCRFVTFDPDTTEPSPHLMKLLHDRHGGRAGVYAPVVHPGRVAVGDIVQKLS